MDQINEFRDVLEKETEKKILASFAREIVYLSKKLTSLMEAECNRKLEAFEYDSISLLEEKITKLLTQVNLVPKFNNDPRGYSVKIVMPKSGQYNTWGGVEDGWGIG
jgi:hypothetical protein